MKKLIASVMFLLALLTLGVVVTTTHVGTGIAYADGSDAGD